MDEPWFSLLSSQKIMAGSREMPSNSVLKFAMPLVRNIWMCWTIVGVCALLVQPVAKTPCQKRVIFSSSGRSVLTMR